ncbi:TPA: hypothetical protein ACVU4L_001665 [Vibrio parahaemolyticus]|uniref:hypothetical protein n=1 Tax=Vibrio parahaemolyticus TaxID=670 RepID=UPI001B83D489|nr:hypothetical protein [Vibrio parahaemolyticus]MCC3780980.1 hypothetical protein [Vibrio parahaemolyticus]HBC3919988.1 hypothetical protein [Vibrio parahaemolyticus]
MANLKQLKENLEKNPAARAKFLADLLKTLESNGLDVNDPDVLKSLDLDLDLNDGPKFVEGLKASTVVVTLVM